MIVFIAGATHTGKTLLAQRLMEQCHWPYLSMDLLKMGLIRSGHTKLTPYDDNALRPLLWKIVREMVKTAIENQQNLIVEGGYIPFDWRKDFEESYAREIRFCCLVMSQSYIEKHFLEIMEKANVIEKRLDDSDCTRERLMEENARIFELCRQYHCPYIIIQDISCYAGGEEGQCLVKSLVDMIGL